MDLSLSSCHLSILAWSLRRNEKSTHQLVPIEKNQNRLDMLVLEIKKLIELMTFDNSNGISQEQNSFYSSLEVRPAR